MSKYKVIVKADAVQIFNSFIENDFRFYNIHMKFINQQNLQQILLNYSNRKV
jgi:hypothetical protein